MIPILGKQIKCKNCDTIYYSDEDGSPTCQKCGVFATTLHAKGDQLGYNTEVSVIYIKENPIRVVIVDGPSNIDTSRLSNPGWYFFSVNLDIIQTPIDPKKAILLNHLPIIGIQSFLESYYFKGIGKEIAKKLISSSDRNIFEILTLPAHQISKQISIPITIAKNLSKTWNQLSSSRALHILLRELGLNHNVSNQILKNHGNKIISYFLSDPYQLVDLIPQFSFKIANTVVKKLRLKLPEEYKIAAAMNFCLSRTEKRNGHTCGPIDRAFEEVSNLTNTPPETQKTALRSMRKKFIFTRVNNKEYISTYLSNERDEKISVGIKELLISDRKTTQKKLVKIKELRINKSIKFSDEQEKALNLAMMASVTLITGGPGTGKTTLVRALVAAFKNDNRSVTLCAPTGRAAKRLSETPGLKSFKPTTIHLLLVQIKSKKKSEIDTLIIDESSMIDIELMEKIIEILKPENSLIMIGDADQLPPVGPGQVFKDLLKSDQIPTVRLTGNFRQIKGSSIISAAQSVIRGKQPKIDAKDLESDFQFIEETNDERLQQKVIDLYLNLLPPLFGPVQSTGIQILTPQRTHLLGRYALNRVIQNILWPKKKPIIVTPDEQWLFRGDKVMQKTNDYELGVMNGDIGKIKKGGKKITVAINGRDIEYDHDKALALEPAYAISIHKSQGSEYPAVIIPISQKHQFMLSRNLLYTAITRGKRKVIVIGNLHTFKAGIKATWKDFRYTLLAHKLTNE